MKVRLQTNNYSNKLKRDLLAKEYPIFKKTVEQKPYTPSKMLEPLKITFGFIEALSGFCLTKIYKNFFKIMNKLK